MSCERSEQPDGRCASTSVRGWGLGAQPTATIGERSEQPDGRCASTSVRGWGLGAQPQ
jgi:hypothetical protein